MEVNRYVYNYNVLHIQNMHVHVPYLFIIYVLECFVRDVTRIQGFTREVLVADVESRKWRDAFNAKKRHSTSVIYFR